jgi:bifunctional non-homologous end joining protein LigD
MPANSGSDDRLGRYRAKRSAGRTPEPFGSGSAPATTPTAGRARFVVQKHAARRLHYDFRLEMGGVLTSWAIPRGPSLDPKEKRMAVMVENHPLEYADFEGIIPEGNYGAGAVIVWDRGAWQEIEEPGASLESGKLLFDLHGHKLRGRWTLVRTKRSSSGGGWNDSNEKAKGQEWLLIKKPDGFADPAGTRPPGEHSVLSGQTIEELRSGSARVEEVRAALAAAGAPERRIDPEALRPMLCETREQPFSGKGWLFELKHDGFRLLGGKGEGGRPFLRYRRGRDATQVYPEIDLALRSLPVESILLDGEVVVCDATGRPDFGRLQGRAMLSRPRDIARAAPGDPATYMVFDLLAVDGLDARELPLSERKRLLRLLLPGAGVLRYVDHIEDRGEDFYAGVLSLGLEGMVGKRADSPYRPGRQPTWIKVRSTLEDDFAVVGYTPPSGSTRVGFGGLHLAVARDHGWHYAGKVGGGFAEAELAKVHKVLEESPPASYDFVVPTGAAGSVWVEPRLVVKVRYKEWPEGRLLRQPTFLELRDDKRPEECQVSQQRGSEDEPPAQGNTGRHKAPAQGNTGRHKAPAQGNTGRHNAPAQGNTGRHNAPAQGNTGRHNAPAQGNTGRHKSPALEPEPGEPAGPPDERTITFSNLGKVFWPAERITKGDLIAYYREVSPWLLPYLADRPLVLTRYPDGIEGKSFYQKDAPEWAPEWVRTESVWSEHSQRDIHYFVCDDAESLLYTVNLGTIPLHIWCSRVSDLARPDWCILDLDPKGAPFADVVEVALTIRRVCEDIELDTFVKTSGSTGLHILIPLGGQCTYEQSRTLAGLVSRIVEQERPDIATMMRVIDARGGKVYLDWLQNRHGQLLVSPLSARPLPGAPVSMPLRWSEVGPKLDPSLFTVKTARRRLEKLGDDPVRPVLDRRPDLLAALGRLGERLQAERAPGEPRSPAPSLPGRRGRRERPKVR